MKQPLNYAILKYFTKVDEACADDVMNALRAEYGSYRPFKKAAVVEALMTAESNAVLHETRFDLDEKGDVRVFYGASEEERATINYYIKD